MSDAPIESAPADTSPSGESGGAPSAPAPVEVAPAEQNTDNIVDLDLPQGMQQFDRSYVEKIRNEAASNRTRAKELETKLAEREAAMSKFSAFDGYNDEELQVWQTMANDWKQGNYESAATVMQNIAQSVLGDPNATDAEKAEAENVLADPEQAAASLTAEQVRDIAREEQLAAQAESQRESGVKQIFEQLSAAGYEQGTPEAFMTLWYANNETDGDIDAALEKMKARDQGVIDSYVSSVREGGNPVRIPSSGSSGTPETQQPKDLQEARQMADAWLKERYNQG